MKTSRVPTLAVLEPSETVAGVATAKLVAFREDGTPLLDLPGGGREGIPARSVVELHESDLGHELVAAFEWGDPLRPVVLGVVRARRATEEIRQPIDALLDGRRVELVADHEIVLRCGKASLTLTRDGRIAIEGESLLSRSEGINRIKGGSVQIN